MAHALKRISYATCDPDFCQFAFLSRNPKGPVGIQYCHVFITREPSEVRMINLGAFVIILQNTNVSYIEEFFQGLEEKICKFR